MLSQIEKRYTKIVVELAPPAARITLANPPVNIIDLPMLEELLAAIRQIEARDDLSFIILAGSPRAFSAGVDIAMNQPPQARQMLETFHAVIRALVASRKITLAAVRGACMGCGAELALVCDMIFCTEDSVWQFPEINLACFPPVASVVLPQLVGSKRAAEMILTGQVIHGDEAFHMGLANDAVAETELDEVLEEVGGRLASLNPVALACAKQALCTWDARLFDQKLQEAEKIYQELESTKPEHLPRRHGVTEVTEE